MIGPWMEILAAHCDFSYLLTQMSFYPVLFPVIFQMVSSGDGRLAP
jgi:hypothetical protein